MARECTVRYVLSGGMLQISIHGPNKKLTRQEGIILCPCEAWFSFLLLFYGVNGICHCAQKKCNEYLEKIGLKIGSVKMNSQEYAIQVSMKQTELNIDLQWKQCASNS